jgi:uncharacterized protein (TIGR02391 family)
MAGFADGDELLELPLDQLAARLLRHLREQDENGVQLHISHVVNGAVWPELPPEKRSKLLPALVEAWDWLLARGLIASTHGSRTQWGHTFITRRGDMFLLDPDALERLQAERRMEVDLHFRIRDRALPQFLLGEYELAAFAALREVEIRVRELSGAPESLIGVKLMQEAFRPNDGALYDASLDGGEAEAMMALFRGAIGVFKNPSSHRAVDYGSDPVQASEVVLLADLLLRLLDEAETRLNAHHEEST